MFKPLIPAEDSKYGVLVRQTLVVCVTATCYGSLLSLILWMLFGNR